MGILRSQLVNMNQHYRRFSLDYFLDCQQRLGIRQIELWCGASHFWLDHEGTGDVPALKQKLLDHDVRVVSVTAPSIAYQYQYASQESSRITALTFCAVPTGTVLLVTSTVYFLMLRPNVRATSSTYFRSAEPSSSGGVPTAEKILSTD